MEALFNNLEPRNSKISKEKFKRLINMLNLPIGYLEDKEYDYSDVLKYVAKVKEPEKYICLSEIREEMYNEFDKMTADYILNQVYGNLDDTEKVNIDELDRIGEILLKIEYNTL